MRRQPVAVSAPRWTTVGGDGYRRFFIRAGTRREKIQRLSFQESNRLRLAARGDWRTLRGGEGGLETGGARHLRNVAGASAKPRRAAQTRRALHAARLCGAACRRDRAGALKSRMGQCSGDGGDQTRQRRRQGRASRDTSVSRTALRDQDSRPRLRDGKLSLRVARIDETA